jgi:hypothetical protein
MARYFALKLCPAKSGPMDHVQVSLIRKILEHIGSRLNSNLSDFIAERGQVKFGFDRDTCSYDILESIADEIGIHPSAIGPPAETCTARNDVQRSERSAK